MREHSVVDNSFNFLSMNGGKYRISQEESQRFFKLFTAATLQQTRDNSISLSFRPPKDGSIKIPLMLDVDLDTKKSYILQPRQIITFSRAILQKIGAQTFGVVYKERGYFKKPNQYRTSFHIYFVDRFMTKDEAIMAGNYARTIFYEHFDAIFTNSLDDIIDNGVLKRSCGLVLVGSHKRRDQYNCGKYLLRILGDSKDIHQLKTAQSERLGLQHLTKMYGFVFKNLRILVDSLTLSTDLTSTYSDMLLQGKSLMIPFDSIDCTLLHLPVATGEVTLNIARSFTRLASIFVTLNKEEAAQSADKLGIQNREVNDFYLPHAVSETVESYLSLNNSRWPDSFRDSMR